MDDLDMFNCLNDLWQALREEYKEYLYKFSDDTYDEMLILAEDIDDRLDEWNNFYNDAMMGNQR